MTRFPLHASAVLRTRVACIALGLLPLTAAGASDAASRPGAGPAVERPAAVQGSEADGSGSLITFRRTLGLAFLAGGAALTVRGFDYKDEADAFYEAYKAADEQAEIQKLYQRTTNRGREEPGQLGPGRGLRRNRPAAPVHRRRRVPGRRPDGQPLPLPGTGRGAPRTWAPAAAPLPLIRVKPLP